MSYSPWFYTIFASFLALVFMYIDTKLFDNPKTKSQYVKGMLLVGGIVWIVIYIINKGIFSSTEPSSFISGLNEEILTGPVNF
jgi:hypothetical protein